MLYTIIILSLTNILSIYFWIDNKMDKKKEQDKNKILEKMIKDKEEDNIKQLHIINNVKKDVKIEKGGTII